MFTDDHDVSLLLGQGNGSFQPQRSLRYANLRRKALEVEKQCLCWRPAGDAGQVLFSTPLRRGSVSTLGSASFFVRGDRNNDKPV